MNARVDRKPHTLKLRRIRQLILFMLLHSVLITGCISVQLNDSKVERAKALEFQPVPAPFIEIKSSTADKAWKSEKTGNTIAFQSACGPKADVPLITIPQDVASSFDRLDNSNTETVTIDGREGTQISAIGMIDGVQTRIRVAAFKKNGCLYTLSFVTLPRFYQAELTQFENFVAGFKAP